MGLDISVEVDDKDVIFPPNYLEKYFYEHQLSRTFCNFIVKRTVCEDQPELDQIGILTGINIEPFYEMDDYGNELQNLDYQLETAESDTKKLELLADIKASKVKISGNINLILQTINGLISRLSEIINLSEKLDDNGLDTLNNKVYFSSFDSSNTDEFGEDNFGKDLYNFKHILEYAKDKGAKTVFFKYG